MAIIGLQMYTLRKHMNDKEEVFESLKKVAAIGYQQVQISVPAFMTVEELKAMLDEVGLKADSAMCYVMKVNESQEEFDKVIHNAEVLGTKTIRLDGMPMDMAQTANGFKGYAAILDRLGRRFHEAGYTMYYHFHAFEWINFGPDSRGIDILLNETNPEYVGFQPDVFWLTSAGTEASVSLRKFEGRAKYMHVKDYAVKARTGKLEDIPNAFASVGYGNLNWPGIIKTANEIGIEQFVVEQDQCDGDEFEAITESYKNLRKFGV